MYSDNKLILQIISLMKQHGILSVVISPGSRHYPLVRSLERDPDFSLYSVVDERSAAFFALGLIQNSGAPVAVCCTSGTSAINYGSAVVEAFYQGLPLVVLTADRLPELLNQKEEQMFLQKDVYDGFIRYQGQLPEVKDGLSEWYCNRVINEAFLELDHHGRGPVHLNFPVESHHTDKFSTESLPKVRKISRVRGDDDPEIWQRYASWLSGRKIMIVWGQSAPTDEALSRAVERFIERFDCVILADKLSNCHTSRTIETAYLALRSMTLEQTTELAPDVVITLFGNYTFNGELKGYLSSTGRPFEVWDLGTSRVSDPFRRLSTVFEVRERFFFEKMCEQAEQQGGMDYYEAWSEVDGAIEEPQVDFGEIHAVGQLVRKLPKNAQLHIANSLPIRMVHLFRSDPSVTAYCNRGVNGIDGCMSAAVGFAAATSDPVYLVIGDLTFFYDMNALWNRHLSKNLRILMLNNEGGGVMHMPLSEGLAPQLSRHISAGHATSAKGWVESVGFRYLAATTREECDAAIDVLTNPAESGPILVEVFSVKEDDVRQLKTYLQELDKLTFGDRVRRRLRRKLPKLFR
ncbi:2-succinyl-5-enolpyruvyl-6-hydroxy-3-cyclohexene-1-carboxylic-acid synthase [Parazoarcus communis]|uniref:2-succinyl-5-enolpyruvyl-6-hydroxy-3-cyclohexene-1-carboxylate synthase n=1 Tax=Parazoarcus communis TaxID=41977 RepID=A0A2U8GV60_9RHOO|nr:2-succinyl-5-enolpyruvyl-6-hydroxy-3-cyclohexene-1-carboxylic-acid synthase [Parazoarcus communis]AWI77589.1 2-succinyl-5-enolpyruvyl-6-hydroxy-3-cyclohexene-1-carboxylic-acid synthase [Parazoarcus communis]